MQTDTAALDTPLQAEELREGDLLLVLYRFRRDPVGDSTYQCHLLPSCILVCLGTITVSQ